MLATNHAHRCLRFVSVINHEYGTSSSKAVSRNEGANCADVAQVCDSVPLWLRYLGVEALSEIRDPRSEIRDPNPSPTTPHPESHPSAKTRNPDAAPSNSRSSDA